MYTFVGGKNDGKRLEVQRLPIIELVEPQIQEVTVIQELLDDTSTFNIEAYALEVICGNRKKFYFYRSVSIGIDEAIRKLLTGYKP